MLVLSVTRDDALQPGVGDELGAMPAYITRCVDRTTKSVRTITDEKGIGLRMDGDAIGVGDERIHPRTVDRALTETCTWSRLRKVGGRSGVADRNDSVAWINDHRTNTTA